MDRVQLLAVASALVLDLMVLGAMVARIGDLGFTPNRVAALGLNLVLLVNLAGGRLAVGAVSHGTQSPSTASSDGRPPTCPVFALWAAAVVAALPPLFAFA